jgi:hypothetical protein
MKQYILKPGKHQFAPGSPAIHDNDNLCDEEAKWYLEKFPHIKSLFESIPATDQPIKTKRKRITSRKTHSAPQE